MNKNNLPNNLYELRRKSGLSQEDFAEKLSVSRQAVSKWERGEAYPDTENLIAISDMFGVTIDELLKSENISSAISDNGEDITVEEKDTPHLDADDKYFQINVKDKVKVNLNGKITVDDNDTKVKIDLGNGGITVNDDDSTVKVDLDGITVNEDDGTKIKLGKHGIKIITRDDDDEDDDDDDGDTFRLSLLEAAPYPVITALAFLLLGLFFNAWYWAWTLFMSFPVYYSLAGAIKRRKFSEFAYPIFVAFVYCLFGMLFKIWHPGWVIFLTIPIYSPIAEAIDRRNAKSKKSS